MFVVPAKAETQRFLLEARIKRAVKWRSDETH